jgi:hypothetical protein
MIFSNEGPNCCVYSILYARLDLYEINATRLSKIFRRKTEFLKNILIQNSKNNCLKFVFDLLVINV